jgi:hypothetical protein
VVNLKLFFFCFLGLLAVRLPAAVIVSTATVVGYTFDHPSQTCSQQTLTTGSVSCQFSTYGGYASVSPGSVYAGVGGADSNYAFVKATASYYEYDWFTLAVDGPITAKVHYGGFQDGGDSASVSVQLAGNNVNLPPVGFSPGTFDFRFSTVFDYRSGAVFEGTCDIGEESRPALAPQSRSYCQGRS